ncbi:hypothetical protein PLESTF_001322500 [Pleodorina starrii]|nr:hypothetical protein PLESTF_001322500 [Pleodorina starrii]
MFGTSTAMRPCTSRIQSIKVTAVAAPLNGAKGPGASNGGGPRRVLNVQTSVDDINKALAACIKQAGMSSSLDKINKGIAKEISKAAVSRFGK